MKRNALSLAALLIAAPAAAQVATIPAPAIPIKSLAQGWGTDITTSISATLYGYTPTSQIPHLLTQQTAKIAPLSLLQTQFSVEFPANTTNMTVMQMVVKSTASAPTFQATSETVTPKQPLSIQVPAGKKMWVVYKAPQGQQATLSFYVGTPPATASASACTADGTTLPPAASLNDCKATWTLSTSSNRRGYVALRDGKAMMGTDAYAYGCWSLSIKAAKIYCRGGQGWVNYTNGAWVPGAP